MFNAEADSVAELAAVEVAAAAVVAVEVRDAIKYRFKCASCCAHATSRGFSFGSGVTMEATEVAAAKVFEAAVDEAAVEEMRAFWVTDFCRRSIRQVSCCAHAKSSGDSSPRMRRLQRHALFGSVLL